MEITLTEVAAGNEIHICTQRSVYRFKVSNPTLRRGLLTGGPLGLQQRDAYLAGSIFPDAVSISESKNLEIGTRALFYLDGEKGVDILTTSVITELAFGECSRDTTACHEAA